MEIHCTRATDI